jgi:rhodanese-related sulfurtransferase
MFFSFLIRKTSVSIILLLLFTATSCSTKNGSEKESVASTEKTMLLLDWFEKNGNYINSPEIPSIMDAQNVWDMREENIHIIDLREPEDFREAHIGHAVNLQQTEVLDYFMHSIDPASFKGVFLVCYDLNTSGYVAGVMRLLGYDNVFAIRFGMSGWDRSIAEKYWLANISNRLVGKLETKGFPMNKPGDYPEIDATAATGFEIGLERAAEVLQHKPDAFGITIEEFLENPGSYYTICYWPEDKYLSNGHLPGAVQYDPKKSLSRDTYLNTLPLDKPTVIYCYSGQHSTFVAAYLRMLGYDARSLAYGANGFIHEVMARTEPRPTRTFTENLIQELPVVKGGVTQPAQEKTKEFETITVEGGC